MKKNLKITKKILVLLFAFVLVLSSSLIAFADTITDERLPVTQAFNRYSRIKLRAYNSNDDVTYTITSDNRVGMFKLGDTQNMYTDILKTTNGITEYQELGMWINTYPKSNDAYSFPSITQGFLSDWISTVTDDRYNNIDIYFDEMIYLPNSYHFDKVTIRGSAYAGMATGTITGNIVTHNNTTGENVVKPFTKTVRTENIANAQSIMIWESDDILEYYPYFQGSTYKLTDVHVSLTVRNTIEHLSVASAFVNEEEYRVYKEFSDNLSNSGSDLKSFSFDWLIDAIEAFFAFELLPGLPLSYVFYGICGISMLIAILKLYLGG